jgi:hypothetical protein
MTRFAIALVAMTALAGCDSETIPVHLVEFDDLVEDRALVEEAAAILGLEARFVTWEYGAVQLTLRDGCNHERGECGRASTPLTPLCHNLWAWSERKVETVAHELGHQLGLADVGHTTNLMFTAAEDVDLTDEQLDTLRDRAAFLNACR